MKERKSYKNLFWAYLLLLIFEGGLRKWVLPGLATPLLLVREPLAIYMFVVAMRNNWLNNLFCGSMISVATLSLVTTLIFGHQNLFVALYGWRIYALDFPMIFIMGRVLNREDILKMGRCALYISIPMTMLIVNQFFSPQSAFVNRGVGGDLEGGGFSGAMGYFRPPGTFSFTSGYIQYQFLVGSFLSYYLVTNKSLKKTLQIKPALLLLMTACYAITIPYSISRSHFFQTLLLLAILFIGVVLINRKDVVRRLLMALCGLAAVLFIVQLTGIAGTGLDAFTERFSQANESEGKGNTGKAIADRLAYGLFQELPENLPFWGYGIGLGTNAGAKLAGGTSGMFSFFNAESETNRIFNESGLLLGGLIIAVRMALAVFICYYAYKYLRSRKDLLLWMLLPGTAICLVQGQWGIPTSMGFTAIFVGFAHTLIVDKEKKWVYGH
ncbi:MAG: hypothetical protein QM642_02540 [Edaphocola sp.]